MAAIADADYAALLDLRVAMRRFLHWSEQQAEAEGLTASQHQLLLAIRGHDDPAGPTIGDIAELLLVRHHSAVGLVDRTEAAGLLRRTRDRTDRRIVRLALTARGVRTLERLSRRHLAELRRADGLVRALGSAALEPAPPGRRP